eukprot:6487620-Amphidinium_carterae.1
MQLRARPTPVMEASSRVRTSLMLPSLEFQCQRPTDTCSKHCTEAKATDPQQRLLLTTAYDSVHGNGYDRTVLQVPHEVCHHVSVQCLPCSSSAR